MYQNLGNHSKLLCIYKGENEEANSQADDQIQYLYKLLRKLSYIHYKDQSNPIKLGTEKEN